MNNFLEESLFAGVTLSLIAYLAGSLLRKKFKLGIFNPLLISIAVSIAVLAIGNISYETYNEGAKYLSWLLTPATVCLAIPLYEQWSLLKQNCKAVMLGLAAGTVTSLGTVLGLSLLCGLDHKEYVTLLPKSITTACLLYTSSENSGSDAASGFGQAVLTGADAAQLSADDEPVAVNDDNYEVQEDGQIGILALNSGGKITMRRSSVAVMGRNSCGITAANGASIDGEQVNLSTSGENAAAAATLDLTSVIDLSDSTMETAASGSPCVISAGNISLTGVSATVQKSSGVAVLPGGVVTVSYTHLKPSNPMPAPPADPSKPSDPVTPTDPSKPTDPSQPTDSSQQTTSAATSSAQNSSQQTADNAAATGDNFAPVLWIAIAAAALAGIGVVLAGSRRKKQ